MTATIFWVGGLVILVTLVIPAARQTLASREYARLLGRIRKGLFPLGWLCLSLLTASGLFQMSASPYYAGFLAIGNRWAAAILAKHLVFLGIVGIYAWITWGILPELERAALLQSAGIDVPELERLQSREARLLRLNAILSLVVLALTALARAV